MNYPLSFLSSIASILALWIAFDAGYRPYRVSVLRSQLLQLRSELFEAARQGRFGVDGFGDAAYLGVRQGLNGFMRYGHQFTIFRLLVLLWSSRWWFDSEYAEARWRSLTVAVTNHPHPAKEELTRIMREAEYAIVLHMINVNVVGFVCLRVWACAARLLRIQRGLRDGLVRMIDEHRTLLMPIEEDATRVFDREEQRGIA